MPEIGPVFGEVDRVLKPGGSFYLSDIVADSTPLARALRSVWKRLLRFEASNAPTCPSSQAGVAGDGRELHRPATELTRGLAARGFACQLRFFTHVGLQRYLSTRQRARVIRVLSAPWKKRGDVLFVYARKAAQRTDELGTG
jgi:SAM-dependent methyltransferase